MFVDTATVAIQAGDGGDGHVSFRHEKFIDRGGPDGGDGGKGGDIVFVASRNENTLASFRFQKKLAAEPGTAGSKQRKHGKNGADLRVKVPVGTIILGESGGVLADLTEDGLAVVMASGGQGGFGNAHFVSSTRQAPRLAEKGAAGAQLTLTLELKTIADVGLVGLPNAGKSSLLSVLSNARPAIADYPFTTLTPHLGVVDFADHSMLFADIPGLIEGASEGKGLGDEFLRHIERTAVLVHLIDAYQNDVAAAYRTIQTELQTYKVDLSRRPQIVALNKTEGLSVAKITGLIKKLHAVAGAATPVLAISAQAHQGLQTLLKTVAASLQVERNRQAELAATELPSNLPVISLPETGDAWQVERQDGRHFVVTGAKIERFASRTDFANSEGVARLRDIMRRTGIMHELARQGAKPGAKIRIAHHGSIEY